MRFAIVEFFPVGHSPEVIIVSDPDGFPLIFGSREEADDWAFEGNCDKYQIIEF